LEADYAAQQEELVPARDDLLFLRSQLQAKSSKLSKAESELLQSEDRERRMQGEVEELQMQVHSLRALTEETHPTKSSLEVSAPSPSTRPYATTCVNISIAMYVPHNSDGYRCIGCKTGLAVRAAVPSSGASQ